MWMKEVAKYFELPMGGDVWQILVKWESRHHHGAKLTTSSSLEPSQHTQEQAPHGKK